MVSTLQFLSVLLDILDILSIFLLAIPQIVLFL